MEGTKHWGIIKEIDIAIDWSRHYARERLTVPPEPPVTLPVISPSKEPHVDGNPGPNVMFMIGLYDGIQNLSRCHGCERQVVKLSLATTV
jgi:hypothetical protein